MKTIMLMYDSLNLRMLSSYGCDWTKTPNFQRLAEHTVTFDNCYVGSMPCMPARRELHTGRYNFLHRSWGPVEPFDDSAFEILQNHGVYTHLVTDHYHYWEDGGLTYHSRYSSYEFFRGQEGDACKADVSKLRTCGRDATHKQIKGMFDQYNRTFMTTVESQPQARTFAAGLEFIDTNHETDNWMLQLETFDPHEPFFAQDSYRELYPHALSGDPKDWPLYGAVHENQEEVEHMRMQYAALLTMCDDYLGKLLDKMDAYHLWDDTMLIVNTDHGLILGEHDCWAKNVMPWYNENAHIPLFIWDPVSKKRGERSDVLAQTIDIPVTILDFFGIGKTADMQGISLLDAIRAGKPGHEGVLFGIYGGHINCTDGRYVYMRGIAGEKNEPLYQYTHMPTHLYNRFSVEEMRTMEVHPGFPFTKGCPVMKIHAKEWDGTGNKDDRYVRTGVISPYCLTQNLLFDLESDPGELTPLCDPELEERMIRLMIKLMQESDAPHEQYVRTGLDKYL